MPRDHQEPVTPPPLDGDEVEWRLASLELQMKRLTQLVHTMMVGCAGGAAYWALRDMFENPDVTFWTAVATAAITAVLLKRESKQLQL